MAGRLPDRPSARGRACAQLTTARRRSTSPAPRIQPPENAAMEGEPNTTKQTAETSELIEQQRSDAELSWPLLSGGAEVPGLSRHEPADRANHGADRARADARSRTKA